jgi:hypothetical protein
MVSELAAQYAGKGYKPLIVSSELHYIPDLLLISPEGKVVWIEVETTIDANDRKRFDFIKRLVKNAKGEFHVFSRDKTKIYPTLEGEI